MLTNAFSVPECELNQMLFAGETFRIRLFVRLNSQPNRRL